MTNFTKEYSSNVHLDPRYGYFATFMSIFFFHLVNLVVAFVGPPKSMREDKWRWKNLIVSWIHALVCSVWCLSSFVLYPEEFHDMIVQGNTFMYLLIAFSTGYFTYDFIDMMINNKLFKLWEVTLHHIAVASMFWYNIQVQICISYNMVALLAEVNSFFLHSRKLLQMVQIRFEHWFYKFVAFLNLVTFVIFRGLSLGGITYGMFLWYTRVPRWYYGSICGSMIVMNVMNPILFWRLLKSDFMRGNASKEAKPFKMVNGNNNVKNHVKQH